MEPGGGAWPERLRPLQLPHRPPLCDRLTHLPLSLEYPWEHIICCRYDSASQYPNTHRPWETFFPEGLFMCEGADGCCLMHHLTGVCTGVVLGPCCGVLVHILDLRFARGCYWWRWFYPMKEELRCRRACCCSTWLLVECAVSYNYHSDSHLSCPMEWHVWWACTTLLLKDWRIFVFLLLRMDLILWVRPLLHWFPATWHD